jgi:hypothetical protein
VSTAGPSGADGMAQTVLGREGTPPVAALGQRSGSSPRARRGKSGGVLLVWATRIVFLVLVVGSWQVLTMNRTINPAFSGEPSQIWSSFNQLFGSALSYGQSPGAAGEYRGLPRADAARGRIRLRCRNRK